MQKHKPPKAGRWKGLFILLILAGAASPFAIPDLLGQKTAAPESRNVTIYAPSVQATIYSNNLAFVSRRAEAEIGKGNYNIFLQNLTNAIDFETISIRDSGGSITELQQYSKPNTTTEKRKADLTFEEILNKSAGKEITALTKNGAKTGALLWHDLERIAIGNEKGAGLLKIEDIEEITTPLKEYTKTEETNTTTTESGIRFSEKSTSAGRHAIEAKYLAQGVTWAANYKYYIEEEGEKGSGSLQAWAKITNNLEDWENIALQVVVGYPRTISYNPPIPYTQQRMYAKATAMEANMGGAPPSIEPQFTAGQVTDYYVYGLKNTATIKKGEEKEISLFENAIEYEREYSWDTSWEKPRKTYKLKNSGKESWAAGVLRIYLGGDLLGEDRIAYTPAGKTADAYIADAPDITGKTTTLSTETEQAGRSRITTYKVNVSVENRKTEKIELKITASMAGGDKVEVIDSTTTPTSRIGNTLEWRIPLASGQGREILYAYRVTNQYYY